MQSLEKSDRTCDMAAFACASDQRKRNCGEEVLRHVLAQVASNSGVVRLAAMEVLQHFPRWDTEACIALDARAWALENRVPIERC